MFLNSFSVLIISKAKHILLAMKDINMIKKKMTLTHYDKTLLFT